MSFVLSSLVFHILPTILEVSMVTGILAYQYGIKFSLAALVTLVGYTGFTIWVTALRYIYYSCVNVLFADL